MIFLRRKEIVRHPVGKVGVSQVMREAYLKLYDKSILMGYQENPDIDIGKGKSSSKVINLLRRMDRPFLVTFFFSFHKEKKKVTERFEIKEKFILKRNLVFWINSKLDE